jgi:hypothetical protein
MRPLGEREEGRGGGGIIIEAGSAESERLGMFDDGLAAWALGVVGDSGSSMAGGTIVGGVIVGGWSTVGALSSVLRCLKAEAAVSAEVVFESPFNSMPPDDLELRPASAFFLLSPSRRSRSNAFVSLPSVMAATPPKLCHRSHSHCGGRKMTKTTDATMSEMPSKAIVGGC